MSWTAILGFAACAGAHAAGLGTAQVQSALGEPLRVSVALLGSDTASYEAHCVRAMITSLEGTPLIVPFVRLNTGTNSTRTIQLGTREALNEPAFNIALETSCGTPLRREYQILLDPVPVHTPQSLTLTVSTSLQHVPVVSTKRRATEQADAQSEPKPHKTKRRSGKQKSVEKENAPSPQAEEPRNVLKMSEAEKPVITRLEVVNENNKGEPTAKAAEAAPTPSEDASKMSEAMALVKAMREETQAMREETRRFKQQFAHDRSEMEDIRKESLLWIRILIGLVTLCAAAIIWLLWRMRAIKQSGSRVTWNEFFPDTTSTTTTQMRANTEFSPTTFQNTSINTGESVHLGENSIFNTDWKQETTPAAAEKTDDIEEADDSFRYISGGGIPYIYSSQTDSVLPQVEVKEDEIAGVMELAEAWMATHDATSVAALLEPFAKAESPQSPLPLLCLLDVYRSLNDRAKHDAIRQRIKTIYNVRPAEWEQNESESARSLADYTHVRQRIIDLWESDEIADYLEDLVMDKRNGLREGFDLPAYRDILRLKAVVANGRSNSHTMPPQAYAILFAQPRQNAAKAPSPANTNTNPNYSDEPAVFVIDETEIKLDEPDLEFFTEKETAPAAKAPEQSQSSTREEMSPMSIKLHLAEAYRDIGDKEGATLLLEEVLHEGTPEQIVLAKQMLKELK